MWRRLRFHRSPKKSAEYESSTPSEAPAHLRSTDDTVSPERGRTLSPSNALDSSRRNSQPSPFSSYRRLSSSSEQADALGLHVIYQPESAPALDIIFVHGLGGASHKTWSKFQDPNLFWPQQWLPFEPEISAARILTFGYNASFRAGGPKNISNIGDFAKDLLFELRFGKDENAQDLVIGRVPIVFVAHSMGGLVVKKAYLLGQNDPNYQSIVHSMAAMMFLATPHRGTNLADLLNKMLMVSFQSPKSFIMDLDKSSYIVEELNEQFRHVAARLSIVSFYETLHTAVGPIKLMVLEKESSILGYPGEISKPLSADHHDVCKYANQEDPSYLSIRNALGSLVARFRSKGEVHSGSRAIEDTKEVDRIFAISRIPEDDLDFFRQRWMPGTCAWVLSEPALDLWLEEKKGSRIAWLNAAPASGKSILSAFIIHHIQNLGFDCQYFFFRFGDQTKRSMNALLRSIGFQLARDIPGFRSRLSQLLNESITLEKTDARTIWQKILMTILNDVVISRPIYWVIDALDESDSPKMLPEFLQSLSTCHCPIRVLVVSRKTETLSLAFDRLSSALPVDVIDGDSLKHNHSDIRTYVEREVEYIRGDEKSKRQIIENVLERSAGNFLWVHLVLEELSACHTQEAIQKTLEELPAGMTGLYQRMESHITNKPRREDRMLAKSILTWAICAHRSLTLTEISQALQADFPGFLDLRSTIPDVCGHFFIIDQQSHVVVVHQTARDYLTKTSECQIRVDIETAHQEIFLKTMSLLLQSNLRSQLGHGHRVIQSKQPFLSYAATAWMYHLRQSGTTSDVMLDLLVKFFRGPFVITWIHLLALFNQLQVLIQTSRTLTSFVSLNRKLNVEKNPLLHRIKDIDLLDSWALDIIKVAGKFGRHLLQKPSAIYKIIPPLCPQESIIYQQFHQASPSDLSVSGISNMLWSDCLARISLSHGAKAWKIQCSGQFVAVLTSTGRIHVWESSKFEDICTLRHSEHVTAMCFNSRSDRFVSYGLRTTKIWSIPTAKILNSVDNPVSSKALAISFAENDTKVLLGSDDKAIRHFDLSSVEKGWQILEQGLLKEASQIEGGFITSPCCMKFNSDATQIAVAYRGYPLSVWDTNEPRLIGRCKRVVEHRPDHARPSVSWMAVDRVAWNPVTGHLLGLYKDGCIFKWNPVGDENQEVRTTADEIEASPDGRLFITSDSNGTVKVWDFTYFSVVYQLSSENLVTSLAFSPDCRRFYDLRGNSVNVWEPNSLVRLSEEALSETSSEEKTLTSLSVASEAYVVPVVPICVLAAAPQRSIFCAANDNGIVTLFDKSNGTSLELMKFSNFQPVTQLTWGKGGERIAAADLSGNIMVKDLNYSNISKRWEHKSLLTAKVHSDVGGVHQMLLSPDSTMLLIICQDYGQIWSVETGRIEIEGSLENGQNSQWANHPQQDSMVLGIGHKELKIFRWADLRETTCLKFNDEFSPSLDRQSFETQEEGQDRYPIRPSQLSRASFESKSSVDRAMSTQDKEHFLIQISKSSMLGKTMKRVIIFRPSILELSTDNSSSSFIDSIDISGEVLSRIEISLGVLPRNALVFLDRDLWVCTLKLESAKDVDAIKRHFFIPRDWATAESLEQCCLLDDGTILCPKDGEVAILSSSLGVGDW